MFFISAVVEQIFNPTAELLIHVEMLAKEAKPETETHPLTTEVNISKYSK